jgi:NCAIR mutase (PurE)-related protein
MDTEKLRRLLEQVQHKDISIGDAIDQLKDLPYKDLGHTKIDNHRELRTGYPEVIFCQGKTASQVCSIMTYMTQKKINVLGTRATRDQYEAVAAEIPAAVYHESARAITIKNMDLTIPDTSIAILTAGTSDIPVAEEAAVTAEIFGNRTDRYFDVGIAGIHRLYDNIDKIRKAKVIIVIAGMEGALPSIVGGLVDKPVIAVPTSTGYGANFNGLSALLGMLTSCAAGVCVVNIDNGFGAGYMASMINKL